ncbi:hypothetical protein PIROE2DRAFT_18863 [Piromyces sp. E2]|nr:hypothetical protein PIROE2DRAFT_18863 [Piromyces sp. E2]|eukprot:OUM56509.1 hypothetical protein PIROE2DRAFT_18863 [Piromyces sp. E2]
MYFISYNERRNLRKVILNFLTWDASKTESFIEFEKFINYYGNKNINDSKFDILTFTIENIKKENVAIKHIIKLIIEKFQYQSLNYSFKINKYCKTPLYCAIVNNKLEIAKYLISKGGEIEYVNEENLDIIEYIKKYCLKKINDPRIFIFILKNYYSNLRKTYDEKIESDIIKTKENEILYKIENIIPDLIINKKYKLITGIIKFYSLDSSYSYIIELILKGKYKTPLSTKELQIICDQRKLKFKIKDSYYKYTSNSFENINDKIIYKPKKINLFRHLLFLNLNNKSNEFFENILKNISRSKKTWVIEKILEVLSNSNSIIEKINFKDILYTYKERKNLQFIEILLNFLFTFHSFEFQQLQFKDYILSILEKFDDELLITTWDYNLNIEQTFNNEIINKNSLKNILKLIIEKENSISFDIKDLLYSLCEMKKLNIFIFIMKILKREIHLNNTNLLIHLINNANYNRKDITTLIYCLISNNIINLWDIKFQKISTEMVNNTIICVNDENEFLQRTVSFCLTLENNSKKPSRITNNDKINKTGKLNHLTKPKNVNYLNENEINRKYDQLYKIIIENTNQISHDFINRNKITSYDLNLMFITLIEHSNFKGIKNLLNDTNTKNQINFNNDELTVWEYPLILSYKICKTTQLENKIIMDMGGNEIKIFKTLLNHGADINVKMDNNVTILEDSLKNGIHNVNKVIFDYLIKENERNDNISYKDSNRFNDMTSFSSNNYYERCRNSRKRKFIEDTNHYGNYKRIKYISKKVLKTVDYKFDSFIYSYLFDIDFNIKEFINKENVDTLDCYDKTILYYAFLKYDIETIKYLIRIYSDKIIKVSLFDDILDLSLLFNCTEIFFEVIRNNNELCFIEDISRWDLENNPIVMSMSISSDYESKSMIYHLLKKGAMSFAIEEAIEKGKSSMLDILLIYYPYNKNYLKLTHYYPLLEAIYRNNFSIVQLLVKKGLNVNEKVYQKLTMLHHAFIKENADENIIEFLISCGATFNISKKKIL